MIRSFARRISATVAMAGAVLFGAVVLAPVASAETDGVDVDGGYVVIETVHGPDAFLVTDRGRSPIFFCDADNPNQRHNLCQPDPASGGRF